MELLIILIIFFFLMGVLSLLGFLLEYDDTKDKRRFKYATIFCLVADVVGIVLLVIFSI
nr:MAG TPA: hypothetical protein [Bacteriophage sp.]